MDIPVTLVSSDKARKKPADESKLGFGTHFSNHMFILDYEIHKGWHAPRIVPYGPFMLDPAAVVLHYAQAVFLIWTSQDGRIRLPVLQAGIVLTIPLI